MLWWTDPSVNILLYSSWRHSPPRSLDRCLSFCLSFELWYNDHLRTVIQSGMYWNFKFYWFLMISLISQWNQRVLDHHLRMELHILTDSWWYRRFWVLPFLRLLSNGHITCYDFISRIIIWPSLNLWQTGFSQVPSAPFSSVQLARNLSSM